MIEVSIPTPHLEAAADEIAEIVLLPGDPLRAQFIAENFLDAPICYNRVRNICAHHRRLWNVGLGVYPALPAASDVVWLADRDALAGPPDRAKRLYPVLVSIQSILSTVSPHSSWATRLTDLLHQHPDIPLRGMGLFPGWDADPFWAEHTA